MKDARLLASLGREQQRLSAVGVVADRLEKAENELAGVRELVLADDPDMAAEARAEESRLHEEIERLERELGDQPGEYLQRFGLTAERLASAAPQAMVMHPGPINRGVEIEDSIADDPQRSLIVRQVEYGVAVRMACLDLLISGS